MANQAKKFGTFAGVFTPSILTILGVIMYMRLGWVVGQAGMLAAIGIVVIAHIISVSTGLSISSIATDKKIKTGGIYYILSRSLGLPIGGAIGITIFVGTALSISLYVIGFCENFIGIERIAGFIGLEPGVEAYRLVGTGVLLLLVLIAFISTSLAIKTQYIILAFIGLSLVSVFTGFFINSDFNPDNALLAQAKGGETLAFVFAVFFPAVTGFTAGVALSGDLKDPRRNIPVGTMAAVGVGLLVYLALTICLALFVERDILLTDKNFLMRIAWIAPLVVAGIWGATLSSALGGIIGAPRILQAISLDRITPRVFGKGVGGSNEPRNALLLTFLIAEAGILIGELNVIAGLVSMFYIAAYGFINLSFALERWASSDFRPSFKISKWVGIIGFIACFAVMFKIDTLAMIASLVIITGIYFYLKNKLLELDFGDVWQSVWTSVVRSTLHEMDKKQLEERNWRPNIILFSGSTFARPHLIDFGKDLVGNHGFLSNFDLIENKESGVLFPKHEQSLQTEDSQRIKGVFTRKQECRDFYEGVEVISRNYGFAGIEPNTVLLAWGRQAEDSSGFARTVKTLSDLDLNILMMDYDKTVGFGDNKQIDIWWRGRGNNGNLALSLVKYLLLSENWRNASIRLLIVNPVNSEKDRIINETSSILDTMRVHAEIRVINNEVEQKAFYDIIQDESAGSDLIFLGIPEIGPGKEADFVEKTSDLCENIGTVILIKASSRFKELNIGVSGKPKRHDKELQKAIDTIYKKGEVKDVKLPDNPELASYMRSLAGNLQEIAENTLKSAIEQISGDYRSLNLKLNSQVKDYFTSVKEKTGSTSASVKIISGLLNKFIKEYRLLVNDDFRQMDEEHKGLLADANEHLLRDLESLAGMLPEKLLVKLSENDLKVAEGDKPAARFAKWRIRLLCRFRPECTYRLKYKKLVGAYIPHRIYRLLFDFFSGFGMFSLKHTFEARKLTSQILESTAAMTRRQLTEGFQTGLLEAEEKKITKALKQRDIWIKESLLQLYRDLQSGINSAVSRISADLDRLPVRKKAREKMADVEGYEEFLEGLPSKWKRNQDLIRNSQDLDIILGNLEKRVTLVLLDVKDRVSVQIREFIGNHLEKSRNTLAELQEKDLPLGDHAALFSRSLPDSATISTYINRRIDETVKKIRQITRNYPDTLELIDESALNEFAEEQYGGLRTIRISVANLVDYLVQIRIYEPLAETMKSIPDDLREIVSDYRECAQIIDFSVREAKEKEGGDHVREAIDLIIPRLSANIEKTEDLIRKTEKAISDFSTIASGVFTTSEFLKYALNLKQYIKKEEQKKKINRIRKSLEEVKNLAGKWIVGLWYQRSRGVIFAQKVMAREKEVLPEVNRLLNLIESLEPTRKVQQKLPLYYQQMYAGKLNNLDEFWINRQSEIRGFRKVLDRFEAGYGGGILVTGPRFSGKSFFVQHVSAHVLNNRQVITIHPPFEGSVNPEVFRETLEEATGIPGNVSEIFSMLQDNTVLIFEDIELWWEKSRDGLALINQLAELIARFGRNILVIATISAPAYDLIKRMTDLSYHFIGIIRLGSFNAEELREAVLIRHNTSTFKLRLYKHKRPYPRQWDLARIFSAYFSLTGGNVGVALRSWIVNITDVESGYLTLSVPATPDLSEIDRLNTNWYLYLNQFILHRRLSTAKLIRTLRMDGPAATERTERGLNDLMRAGLIRETSPGVFELNEWLYPYLLAKLRQSDMI